MKDLLFTATVLLTTLSGPPAEPAVWQGCNAPTYIFSDEEVEALARLLYGEALNCMIISAQFKNKKYGTYGGRKYSYFCDTSQT